MRDALPRGAVRDQEIIAALQLHLETVWRAKGKMMGANEFDPGLDLYEAGYLDSLMVSEFLVRAEKQYGITIPDWVIGGEVRTLAHLAVHIETELTKKTPDAKSR